MVDQDTTDQADQVKRRPLEPMDDRVALSKEAFKALCEFREFVSKEAYMAPRSIGLGVSIQVLLDIFNFVQQNNRATTTPERAEMVKKYPKRGRPKKVYYPGFGQPRYRRRKEHEL